MGRDNTGKKQEDAQLAAQQARQTQQDTLAQSQLTSFNAGLDKLDANPGLDPSDLAAERAYGAQTIGASYAGAKDAIDRHSAITGHANDDAGLLAGEESLARDKSRVSNAQDLNYLQDNADKKLATRLQVAGLRIAPYSSTVGAADNSGAQGTGLINQREQVDNSPTFWQSLALAGAQGAGAAAVGKIPCWIAEALYGKHAMKTHLVRAYLNTEFAKSPIGKVVMALYLRFGERIAVHVKRSGVLRAALKPLFDFGVRKAVAWRLA